VRETGVPGEKPSGQGAPNVYLEYSKKFSFQLAHSNVFAILLN